MPRIPNHERRKREPTRAEPVVQEPGAREGAVVVPFPPRARRPARQGPSSGEARGEILFFLGVRYERLAS